MPASFAAGSYFLSAVADAGNAIPEAGGNDGRVANGRVAIKTITVIRPDLVVSALTGPIRAARGGTVVVTATVKNLAAAPATAPASSLKFYLSDDQTFDVADVELSSARAIPTLGPGAVSTAATTLTIPASVTTGNKFILARADALDQVVEAQEGNNVTARAIEIGDFADLQITAVAGPATVRAGQNMTVSFTVKNAGTAPVGAFDVTVYLAPAAPPPAPGDGDAVGVKTIATPRHAGEPGHDGGGHGAGRSGARGLRAVRRGRRRRHHPRARRQRRPGRQRPARDEDDQRPAAVVVAGASS